VFRFTIALVPMLAVGACAGSREAPQAVAARSPDVADAGVIADAPQPAAITDASVAAVDASVPALPPTCSSTTDGGVIDVFVHLEPAPRHYGMAKALFVTVPVLGVRAKWNEFSAGAAATCEGDLHADSLSVGCHTFESSFSLELVVTGAKDGGRATLSASSRIKNYDGVKKGSPFEPLALPCGAHVTLHALSRTPHPNDLADGCVARCSYAARTCFASCAARFSEKSPSRRGMISEEGIACDESCETNASSCTTACAPR